MKGNVQQKIYRLFRIGEIKEGLLSWIKTATFSLDAVGYGIYQCLCEETVKTQITVFGGGCFFFFLFMCACTHAEFAVKCI